MPDGGSKHLTATVILFNKMLTKKLLIKVGIQNISLGLICSLPVRFQCSAVPSLRRNIDFYICRYTYKSTKEVYGCQCISYTFACNLVYFCNIYMVHSCYFTEITPASMLVTQNQTPSRYNQVAGHVSDGGRFHLAVLPM